MFKIGLENRDFCKSLHFYIVDAGKKQKNKKKRAASAGLFSCSRPFGPRASPFGRCPHYLFFLCCGALASALIIILLYYYIIILLYYYIIILSYYHIIILSYYHIIILFGYSSLCRYIVLYVKDLDV